MKKLIPIVFFALCALNTSSMFAGNKSGDPVTTPQPATENKLSETEVAKLSARYDEISNMDKSNLSSSEKRELKKESAAIKSELAQKDGTVIWISSSAALIIIIILLIILL